MPLAASKKPDGAKWRKELILQTRGSKFIKFQEARIQVGFPGVERGGEGGGVCVWGGGGELGPMFIKFQEARIQVREWKGFVGAGVGLWGPNCSP
jgi:hypothetical protein